MIMIMSFVRQRVLEHCKDPKTQQKVMDEILGAVSLLAQDQYGNYVVQVHNLFWPLTVWACIVAIMAREVGVFFCADLPQILLWNLLIVNFLNVFLR